MLNTQTAHIYDSPTIATIALLLLLIVWLALSIMVVIGAEVVFASTVICSLGTAVHALVDKELVPVLDAPRVGFVLEALVANLVGVALPYKQLVHVHVPPHPGFELFKLFFRAEQGLQWRRHLHFKADDGVDVLLILVIPSRNEGQLLQGHLGSTVFVSSEERVVALGALVEKELVEGFSDQSLVVILFLLLFFPLLHRQAFEFSPLQRHFLGFLLQIEPLVGQLVHHSRVGAILLDGALASRAVQIREGKRRGRVSPFQLHLLLQALLMEDVLAFQIHRRLFLQLVCLADLTHAFQVSPISLLLLLPDTFFL